MIMNQEVRITISSSGEPILYYLDSHLYSYHVDTLPRSECSNYIASYDIYTSQWSYRYMRHTRIWYSNPYHTRMVIPYAYVMRKVWILRNPWIVLRKVSIDTLRKNPWIAQ